MLTKSRPSAHSNCFLDQVLWNHFKYINIGLGHTKPDLPTQPTKPNV